MSIKQYLFLPLLIVILLVPTLSEAQGYGRKHPFDFKKFNLGFLMGLTYNTYNLKQQVNIREEGVLLKRIQMINNPGLNLGMITNINMSDHVAFRFVPMVSLEQRDFDYIFVGRKSGLDSLVNRRIESSYLNLPFMFQFRTKYYKKYRVYLLAGFQVGLNLGSNKKVRDDPNLLKIASQDFSIVLGTGMLLYGDRLKLSPEIRYSFGLSNIYVPEFTSHASAISQLFSQVLVINFNFE